MKLRPKVISITMIIFAVMQLHAAKIKVTAPNGGGLLAAGASTNIEWTTTGTISLVNIYLTTDNGSDWDLVDTAIPNTGTHPWIVPNVSSDSCMIRVSDVNPNGPSDISDSPFRIVQIFKITVTSPNGGESLQVGTKQQVTWSTWGLIDSVRIELSYNDGKSWIIFTSKTANVGAFNFYVPDIKANSCKIKVSGASDTSISDVNDAHFSIFNPNVGIINQTDLFSGSSLADIITNPVNNTVTFSLHLVKREEVLLAMYSIQGKLITKVIHGIKNAGLHTVLWNGADQAGNMVPGGTYCMRLQIGNKEFAGLVAVIR